MPITLNYTGLRITDAKAGALSTSIAAYNTAANNTYVEITQAEYNLLITSLNATKVGATDAAFTGTPSIGNFTGTPNTYIANMHNTTWATAWPANLYLAAIKMRSSNMTDYRFIHITPSQPTTAGSANPITVTQIGLPFTITNTTLTDRYWVLKGDGIAPTTEATLGLHGGPAVAERLPYLAVAAGNVIFGSATTAGTNGATASSNKTNLGGYHTPVQGLVSTKQW